VAQGEQEKRAARDERLTKLQQATNEWADKEEDRLNKEVALAKKILLGRTGAERLNNASVQSASELLVDELNNFLAG